MGWFEVGGARAYRDVALPTTNKECVFVRESVLNIVDQTQHSTAPQAAAERAGAHIAAAAAAAGGDQRSRSVAMLTWLGR